MDKFTILQWNIRGFYPQKPYLQKCIDISCPDVICLQETHLKTSNVPSLSNYHYPPIKRDREDRRGGGVMIFVKNTVPYLNIDIETEIEIVLTKVFIEDKPITIGNIYLPPDMSNLYVKEQLEKIISELEAPFLLTFDANAHHYSWGSTVENSDTRGNILFDLIESHSLVLLNTGDPTFLTSGGNFTHIDITISSPELASSFNWQTYHDPMNSDHFPIFITTKVDSIENFTPKWNIKKADWLKYQKILKIPENFTSPTQGCQSIIDSIINAANDSIPLITSPPHYPSAYWWTNECYLAKKYKNKCLNKYKKNRGNINLWIEFKKSRAYFRKAVQNAKKVSWEIFLDNFSGKPCSFKLWKQVKILQNKPVSRAILLKEGDQYITSVPGVSEKLCQHFASRSDGNYSNVNFNINKTNAEVNEISFDKIYDSSYNKIISYDEFNHSLNSCNSKSPGPDSLPYSFIQNLSRQQKESILKFFNFVFKNGYPDQWRQGIVIALKKPNKIMTAKESYRPITLNNTLSKLMGKIVNRRLQQYLETINFFSENQSGFRACHSTLDNICRLEHDARMAIMQKKICIAVFIDISQAFDTVWHHGLLMKIKEIGLNGYLANFLKGFLKDREISVRIGSHTSSPYKLKSGVPQGSVLSPTLFTIMINDIFKNLSANISSSLFADDGAIWTTANNLCDALKDIQEAVNLITGWTEKWGLTISKEKTVAIVFTSRHVGIPPSLMIEGYPIKYKNSVKFLGMHFDSRLTWATHINQTVAKCQKDLQLLRIISYDKSKSDFIILKRIYSSLILPKIDYGSVVYSEAAKTHLNKLDKIQINALKIALGALKPTCNYKIEAEAHVMPLEFRRRELLVKYSYRVGSVLNHPIRNFLISKNPIHMLLNNTKIPALYRIFKEFDNFPNSASNIPSINMKLKYQTESLNVFSSLNTVNKSSFGWHQWVCFYNSMIDSKYKEYKQIFTDGSKIESSTGSGVWSENFKLQSKLPKYCTVFTAELYAIYAAVSYIKNMSGKFIILTDSLSAVKTLQSFNATNHYLVSWIKNLLINCVKPNIVIEWVPSHMYISGNERADELARRALDLDCINNIPPSKQEMYSLVHDHYMKSWQTEWSRLDSKLIEFKPMLSPVKYVDLPRSSQVALSRLRLLKTRLCIRRYIRNVDEDLLSCPTCNVPLSLSHVIVECPTNADHRINLVNHFQSSNESLSLSTIVRPNTPCHLITEFLLSADLLKVL